jgi:hypothetical protein
MPRWSNGHDTGPSTRRSGFDSPSRCSVAPATNVAISVPGSRTARRPAVTRKVGVRAPPWQPPPGGRGSRRTAADRVTGVKVPPGRPSHTRTRHIATQVVVVQRRGSRHATPGMRVRVPPTTPSCTPCRRGPEGKGARLVSERERVRSPPPAPIVASQWSRSSDGGAAGRNPAGGGSNTPETTSRDARGREPDGDGTALIPRDDVVRLHDALPSNTHAP